MVQEIDMSDIEAKNGRGGYDRPSWGTLGDPKSRQKLRLSWDGRTYWVENIDILCVIYDESMLHAEMCNVQCTRCPQRLPSYPHTFVAAAPAVKAVPKFMFKVDLTVFRSHLKQHIPCPYEALQAVFQGLREPSLRVK